MRKDIHRPSAIRPEEYEWVACLYRTEDPLTDAVVLKEYQDAFNAHRERTGGRMSQHEHGGVCHICGADCIYTAIFYHEKTNVYIVTGLDCAEKMEMGDTKVFRAFRTHIKDALQRRAGKEKAKALLQQREMPNVWAEYIKVEDIYSKHEGGSLPNEERTLHDIVSKLVRYGDLSDGQWKYLAVLIDRIQRRPEIEAKRKAERDAAAPVPEGRHQVVGTVLKTDLRETNYGPTLKMLVKAEEGYLLWGTVPASLDDLSRQEILADGTVVAPKFDKGCKVQFTATLTPSDNDPKFGFFKRPTKAAVVE